MTLCALEFLKSVKTMGSEMCAGGRGSRLERDLVRDNSIICPCLVWSDKRRMLASVLFPSRTTPGEGVV